MTDRFVTITFHDDQITVWLHDGQPYVAVKPICERLGIDWASQHHRINRDPVLAKGMVVITIPSAGGLQQTVALQLRLLPGFLFGIDRTRIDDDAQDRLDLYREECFTVLFEHFFGPVGRIEDEEDYAQAELLPIPPLARRTGDLLGMPRSAIARQRYIRDALRQELADLSQLK